MTDSLLRAIEKVKLLPEPQQEVLASLLLAEMESEKHWNQLFAGSADQLKALADEAIAEHRAGQTEPLDPDEL